MGLRELEQNESIEREREMRKGARERGGRYSYGQEIEEGRG